MLIVSANGVSAQSQLSGSDGIAASPRARQMLNERKAINENKGMFIGVLKDSDGACCNGTACVTKEGKPIAASPRVTQMLSERPVRQVETVTTSAGVAGYRATGADGITASPRLRQQLDERRQAVEIAPLK